jgi:hypothetical protein
MESKLLDIIANHPSLDNKLHLMEDVKNMFDQIRQIRLENRKLNEQINIIKETILKE